MRFYILLALFLLCIQVTAQKNTKVKMPKKPLSAKVDMHLNRPAVFINGQPQASVIYGLTDVPGGRWSWEEQAQHNLGVFCERGVRMYQLDISFEQMWKEDGSLDISLAQRQIRGLLKACPDAALFFRLHVNAPFWWMDKHQEEMVAFADTIAHPRLDYGLMSPILDDPQPRERVSLASEKWVKESSEMTRLFCKKLAKTPEGRAVIGIQVACGVYGEWHYWGFAKNEPDTGEAMTKHFRKWTREKYQNEVELQAAWQNDRISFEEIQVPDMNARETTQGIFRNPKTEQFAIDYYRCQHQLVSDRIIHFAKIIKEHWPRPIITGTFYGYFFSVFGREVAGGHLELQKIMESPHLDYLAAPQCYVPNARKNGEVYRSRGLVTSCLLNKKLWLDEMDFDPNLHFHYDKNFPKTLSAGRAATRRNMIHSLLKGMGLWFYEFGITGMEFDDFHLKYIPSRGYWDHPALMDDIETIKTIVEDKMEAQEPYSSDADVLFVFDTQSSYYTASLFNKNPMTVLSADWGTLAAYRSGIAFDAIHLSDLEKVNWQQYKAVIFGNTYQLSKKQKEYIKEHIAKDQRHLIWLYAPALVEGQSLSVEAVSQLIGLNLKQTTLKDKVRLALAQEPSQYLAKQNSLICEVSKEAFSPAFAVADEQAIPLGVYQENGQVAAAYKKLDKHTSWYIAAPNKEEKSNLLRYILGQTAAHQYTDDPNAVVYAGWGLLFYYNYFKKEGEKRSVHLKNGKKITFTLPNRGCGVLIDAKNGKILMQGS